MDWFNPNIEGLSVYHFLWEVSYEMWTFKIGIFLV